ncbi:helicase-related protein [Hymenobacter arizonensis]|nr:helicase-related protein [Hymenobacter arizonensis]
MAELAQLHVGATINGILPGQSVMILQVQWHGTAALELVYRDGLGGVGNRILYAEEAAELAVVEPASAEGGRWGFGADAGVFKLVSEAYRIRLAYVFDPMMAVHTSLIEALPHQITAVYDSMLPRQPLKFLLADDPGAGKTIMAGLLIKELAIRGDVHRCLVVCPGVLAEQWQEELYLKFQLPFEILTNDKVNSARTGNWFAETNFVVARLDKLSRDEGLQAQLEATRWDMIIVDEAHKMSASFFGGKVKYTRRYQLGQLLGRLTRHFLLMTATPHNGKDEDFQLFMALLDQDRFEGRFRDGTPDVDVSDMMRRLLKEQLVRFDGRPLFPQRIAETVAYELSDAENRLYGQVTDYVRDQFNRADELESGRRGSVGFALTILQRRLASSPLAIYESLRRRREKLTQRLDDYRTTARAGGITPTEPVTWARALDSDEDLEDMLDDTPGAEQEELENEFVDRATTANTIRELEAELASLAGLEKLALEVRRSGTDRKWEELSRILTDEPFLFDDQGHRRKLVIFTEHRDTLNYLVQRIGAFLGNPSAVVSIAGGMARDERRRVQELFTQNARVAVLVATDAAGEGINLQRAHLMVNYDLPWNPNRLEQRFGRIHRIGQTEVCRLWSLVAHQTREGDVWKRLLDKIELEREALDGKVYDVLGSVTFENKSLRELLVEAVRFGSDPERKAYLDRVLDTALDRPHLESLLQERALHTTALSKANVQHIREEMARAEARKLQPHFVADFFLAALRRLGGTVVEKERGRYQVLRVPVAIRHRGQQLGSGREPVLDSYERITFYKDLVAVQGKPLAAFVCPGHPLLDAVIDLLLERELDTMQQGAVLLDERPDAEARLLFYLETTVQDAHSLGGGQLRTVSRELRFLELGADGEPRPAGYAPYLDYRPATAEEVVQLRPRWETLPASLRGAGGEERVRSFALTSLAREQLERLRTHRRYLVEKTRNAVQERLTAEIRHWDARARDLSQQEEAGKPNARLNSGEARKRADDLHGRLQKRLLELDEELQLSSRPPVVVGGALVLPASWLADVEATGDKPGGTNAMAGTEDAGTKQQTGPISFPSAEARAAVEQAAMKAVMKIERALGNEPRDRSADKVGYDIESRDGQTGLLRFLEVKGRHAEALTVTVTKNEIIHALNVPAQSWLVLALVRGRQVKVHYVQEAFRFEPDFSVTSVNYNLAELLGRSTYTETVELGAEAET